MPKPPPEAIRTGPGLSTKAAAEFLGVTEKTLRNWRVLGKGPPYSAALGQQEPRYHPKDLDQFLWGKMVNGSSEAKEKYAE